MTRTEFILGYLSRSELPVSSRIEDGVMIDPIADYPGSIALPCACGDEECQGWAKVRNDPESIACHEELYGVPGGRD